MIGKGLSLIFMCGLLSTGASALFAQTSTESAARFTDNAMKLRESILFKVEPKNLASNPLQDARREVSVACANCDHHFLDWRNAVRE